MSVAWTDLGDTAAHAVGNVQFTAPIPGVNAPYLLRQRFMQPVANYSALALNTAHSTYTSYKLVSEEQFKDEGGGVISWDRVYAQTPSQHVEFSTYIYSFVGFYGGATVGRVPFPRAVTMKNQFDYYLVDGVIITTPYDIPIIDQTRYYLTGFANLPTEYLADSGASASTPTKTTYEGYISTDAATANSFSLVAQPSTLERWMGNIWRRNTFYIKAI